MLTPVINSISIDAGNPLKYTVYRSGVSLRVGVLSIRTYSGLDGAPELHPQYDLMHMQPGFPGIFVTVAKRTCGSPQLVLLPAIAVGQQPELSNASTLEADFFGPPTT